MISIGIDIGTYSLKVAQVEDGPRGFTLTGYQEYPLSQDPNKDTSIEIIDILRNLFTQYDLSQTRIVFGEKQGHVSSRFLDFPFRERHKILKSLPFELDEVIPFSTEDALFDAKILNFQKVMTQVLAIANPRENVQRWYQFASDVGISADILSVEGVAFCNLNEAWYNSPPESSLDLPELPESEVAELFLVIGHKNTLMVVKSGGVLKAIRNIDWGGKNIAETIARKYSINYVEALKELRAKAFILIKEEGATKDQIAFSNTIKSSIDQLAHELKLTLMEIEGESRLQIQQGYMSGGTSLLRGLAPYLTQKLEIGFNSYKYLQDIPHRGLDETPEVEARAAVSIGLAIEGLKKPRNPAVNLFKGEFEKKSQDLQKSWQKWKHSVQVGAAVFVLLFVWGIWRNNTAQELSDTSYSMLRTQAGNIAKLRGSAANIRNINRFIRTQQNTEKSRDMAEKVKDINSAVDLLNEVSQKIPSTRNIRLEVRRFLVENNTMEIEGLIRNTRELDQLKTSLQTLATDGKVQDFKSKVPPLPGQQAFGLRLKVDRVRGS